ncbi:unnamed protein product [Chironomus riparius]|uniref:Uncharacterized protein n=1 Tax=Chironomus riparius TaxID=315576 RepID=A0A9N9WNU8_9DIPT|nr:unnamed protein product [Chironomus riparius]
MDSIEIVLSAEEVNLHTVEEEDPHKIYFLGANHAPVEGVVPYPELLHRKLREVPGVVSLFRICEGFKKSGRKTIRVYFECIRDGVKMNASYNPAQLKKDQELVLTWEIKCANCRAEINALRTPTVAVIPEAVHEIPPIFESNSVALNELFGKILDESKNVLTGWFREIAALENPMVGVVERRGQISADLATACLDQLRVVNEHPRQEQQVSPVPLLNEILTNNHLIDQNHELNEGDITAHLSSRGRAAVTRSARSREQNPRSRNTRRSRTSRR